MFDTEQFVLVLNDLTKLQELQDVAPTDYPGGEDGVVSYLLDLRGPSDQRLEWFVPLPSIAGGGVRDSIGVAGREHFGFDFRDVESTAVLSIASGFPDRKIEITQGVISASLASDLLAGCGECIQPEQRLYQDIEYRAWANNIRARHEPPLFRAQAFPARLIINDGIALYARDDEGIEALIDLSLGLAKSMASDDDIVALVTAVDEFEATSVVVSAPGFTLDALLDRYQPAEIPEIEEFAKLAPLLEPYLAAATGVGWDDEGPFNVIALVHATEDAARENAVRLPVRVRDVVRQRSSDELVRWSEQIASVETVVDGRTLIARLRPTADFMRPARLEPHESGRINLLIHE